MKTIERLGEVFRDVFEDDDLNITSATTARDMDEWDSLMHVNLILAVEKEFNIRISSSEVAGLQSVGQLVDLIEAKA